MTVRLCQCGMKLLNIELLNPAVTVTCYAVILAGLAVIYVFLPSRWLLRTLVCDPTKAPVGDLYSYALSLTHLCLTQKSDIEKSTSGERKFGTPTKCLPGNTKCAS